MARAWGDADEWRLVPTKRHMAVPPGTARVQRSVGERRRSRCLRTSVRDDHVGLSNANPDDADFELSDEIATYVHDEVVERPEGGRGLHASIAHPAPWKGRGPPRSRATLERIA